MTYRVVVIGTSAGGSEALAQLLGALPADFPLPVVVVRHLHPQSDGTIPQALATASHLPLRQAEEKTRLTPGIVELAAPNYHLLIEEDEQLDFSLDPPENFARPSVDVTLESAIEAFGDEVIGVILTGASHDGAQGLRRVAAAGGAALVQRPEEAAHPAMPEAALAATPGAHALSLEEIARRLVELTSHPLHGDAP